MSADLAHDVVTALRAAGHHIGWDPVAGVWVSWGDDGSDPVLRGHLNAHQDDVAAYLQAEAVVAEAADDLAAHELEHVRRHRRAGRAPLARLDDAGDIDTTGPEWPDDVGELDP